MWASGWLNVGQYRSVDLCCARTMAPPAYLLALPPWPSVAHSLESVENNFNLQPPQRLHTLALTVRFSRLVHCQIWLFHLFLVSTLLFPAFMSVWWSLQRGPIRMAVAVETVTEAGRNVAVYFKVCKTSIYSSLYVCFYWFYINLDCDQLIFIESLFLIVLIIVAAGQPAVSTCIFTFPISLLPTIDPQHLQIVSIWTRSIIHGNTRYITCIEHFTVDRETLLTTMWA